MGHPKPGPVNQSIENGVDCIDETAVFGFDQNAKQADDAQTEPLSDGAIAFFIDEQQLSVEFAGASNGLGLPTIELNA